MLIQAMDGQITVHRWRSRRGVGALSAVITWDCCPMLMIAVAADASGKMKPAILDPVKAHLISGLS